MRSLADWKLLNEDIEDMKLPMGLKQQKDPDWERLRMVWGSGSKPVNQRLVTMLRPKIEQIQDMMVRQMSANNKDIESFRDVPPELRDQIAQALVVATMMTFYQAAVPDSAALGARTRFDPRKLKAAGKTPVKPTAAPKPAGPSPLPQDEVDAPAGWKG